MMEALRNDTICTSDSVHSLSRINPHSVDELSREKEEELLYGAGDDGDEEDALSDDSLRLRLSDDDDIETDEVLASTLDIQEYKKNVNEIEERPRKDEDLETSSILENSVPQDKSQIEEISEEQSSGNVSTSENTIIVNEKTLKKYENKMKKQKVTNMPRPRPNIHPRWRLSNSDGLGFNYDNHPHNHSNFTSREVYRSVNNYNSRLNCPFSYRRGRARYYSNNRPIFNNRLQQRKSNVTQARMNNSAEHGQNVTSVSNTNVSLTPTIRKDISNKEINDSKLINKDDMLNSQSSVSSNENNQSNLEPLKKDIEIDNSHEDCSIDIKLNDNSAISLSKIECNLEVNSEIKVSNTGKCQDVTTIEVCTLKNNNNGKIENSLDTDNIMNIDKIDQNETTKQSINNQKQDEIIGTTSADTNGNKEDEEIKFEKEEDDLNHMLTGTNQKATLPKDNLNLVASCALTEKHKVVRNESIINEDSRDNTKEEIRKNIEDEVLLERSKQNEDCKNDTPEASKATSTCNSINDGDSNKIEIIQNGVSEEPVINNENNSLSEDNSNNVIEKLKDQQTNLNLREENKDIAEKNVEICTEKENSALVCLEVSKTTNLDDECSGNTALNENDSKSNMKPQNNSLDLLTETKNDNSDSIKRSAELPVMIQKKRRRTKKMIALVQEAASEECKQVRESRRQKRQTAKNAEEIIRKKFLNYDSDLESSDSSEKFVAVNYNKMNQDARSLSPPSLKRSFTDSDSATINGSLKKLRINYEVSADEPKTNENNAENIKKLTFIQKFFQRDVNEKLKKLTQEELEELLIQKFVETITMRDEIGTLREQAQTSNRNLEAMRTRCQQLAKQVKDFEMVLNRNAADRRTNNDKPVPPIKINRSVGLQVNFMTDHGIQNLRQLQQNSSIRISQTSSNSNSLNTSNNETNTTPSLRRGIKVRSPRINESVSGPTPTVSQSQTQSPNVATVTPAALVVAAKPVEAQHSLTLPTQASIQQIMPNQQSPSKSQNIVVNGKLPSPVNRQNSTPTNAPKPRANDLIDLTDEEEKSKATTVPVATTTITEQQMTLAQKAQQSCFQRVIQTIPNVSITSQPPPNLRVVQPASQPTPTALVNNMNAPRLAYVMQSGVGPTRQLLIAPQNTNPIRPAVTCRASYPTVTYKGVSTIANGTVRVLTTTAATPVQIKHPAPLPDIRSYAPSSIWKLPPPAPSLKISKVAHGIVLSWNMVLSDKYADIASYQLYAYQEIAGVPPNTSLWKKVGDVRALPLPMACTLTQFSEGNTYYFAVRGVDKHSRKGQYSIPGNITL